MSEPDPWYADGLRFSCTKCGNCCRTADPELTLEIRYTDDELVLMSLKMGLTLSEFRLQCTRPISDGGRSLRSKALDNGGSACIFLNSDNTCQVYAVRPIQCRTFPFWPENLTTPQTWQDAKQSDAGCPGMGRGSLIPLASILRKRDAQQEHENATNGTLK